MTNLLRFWEVENCLVVLDTHDMSIKDPSSNVIYFSESLETVAMQGYFII